MGPWGLLVERYFCLGGGFFKEPHAPRAPPHRRPHIIIRLRHWGSDNALRSAEHHAETPAHSRLVYPGGGGLSGTPGHQFGFAGTGVALGADVCAQTALGSPSATRLISTTARARIGAREAAPGPLERGRPLWFARGPLPIEDSPFTPPRTAVAPFYVPPLVVNCSREALAGGRPGVTCRP